jgi:hypothetical protein
MIFDPSYVPRPNRPAPINTERQERTSIKFWLYCIFMLTTISRMDTGRSTTLPGLPTSYGMTWITHHVITSMTRNPPRRRSPAMLWHRSLTHNAMMSITPDDMTWMTQYAITSMTPNPPGRHNRRGTVESRSGNRQDVKSEISIIFGIEGLIGRVRWFITVR